jgi:chromosome segregation protein
MRLSKIKLAGFKSFVDPTTITLPSNLMGVVGPNGCGKSNIIDAIRWVMGETSAKHLRGDSMSDIIFNGSASRKPVGTASIELVFDNSDGSVGGQYAQYSEIAIKRSVSRDGTSQYFLNNTRCRRKDITHIFLGTGLGSRSYAIIEQGMISRLIEARPEEMRSHLEEAAGISKYKDRRRETETRIRHTRENLERLNDLREEVEKQIRHLQRQARTAERYKDLKQRERRTEAELLTLRLRDLSDILATRQKLSAERETALQAAIAAQRSIEADIESLRHTHVEATDSFNEVQSNYYRVGAEIARLEQSIQHNREMRERQSKELAEADHALADIQAHIDKDSSELEELDRALERMQPELVEANAAEQRSALRLRQAEEALAQWQDNWSQHTNRIGESRQSVQVEEARIEQLLKQQARLADQSERLSGETAAISLDGEKRELSHIEAIERKHQKTLEESEAQLAQLLRTLEAQRRGETDRVTRLDESKRALEQSGARLASLEALQTTALGRDSVAPLGWLEQQSLGQRARLAEKLNVEPGWERAVETALGDFLEAVCVPQLDHIGRAIESLEAGAVTLVEEIDGRLATDDGSGLEPLVNKVASGGATSCLLAGIFVAPDIDTALRLRERLSASQSVITADGTWVGRNWLRVSREQDDHAGVLEREAELRSLRPAVAELENEVRELASLLTDDRAKLRQLESERESVQIRVNSAHRDLTEAQARKQSASARMAQLVSKRAALQTEAAELAEHAKEIDTQLQGARSNHEQSSKVLVSLENLSEEMRARREALQVEFESAKRKAEQDREHAREVQIRVESRRSSKQSASQNLERMQSQLGRFSSRKKQLTLQLTEGEAPLESQEKELSVKLEERSAVETGLKDARRRLGEVDEKLRELNALRGERENKVDEARSALDSAKLAAQEIRVRGESLVEQLAETGFDRDILESEMPEEASTEGWDERLEKLRSRIGRLGPINLAAIEEYKEQSERKEYLDSQFEDLNQALETLEAAIRKIDKETRTRFRETFDKVNAGLKDNFPRLFGGGHAYLELTGEDVLESGVTVMARPPGKRNSSIHLLSGGEKALTAVALVFAIFQLNPAPFCLLDEVDAPLDDANVGRYCEIVKEIAQQVQFLFITHNKVTMEMAHQLTGVTMQEPGVSRLVAVDVDEAVRMAAG